MFEFKVSPWVKDLCLLAVPLAVFSHFALWRLDLPGLAGDEIHTLYPVLSWILGWKQKLILLGGYHGPFESILALPFLLIFGQTATAVRLCPVFYASLTIVTAYFFMKELTGSRWQAWFGTTLLSLAPAFTIASRVGMMKGSIVPFLILFAMTQTLRWNRTGNEICIFLAAIAWGSAAGCRIWVGAFIVACGAALLIVNPQILVPLRLNRRAVFGAFAVFLFLAAGPYVIDNVRCDLYSLKLLLQRHLPLGGAEPSYWESLLHRVKNLEWQLSGIAYFHEQSFPEMKNLLEHSLRNRLSAWIFWVCLGTALLPRRFQAVAPHHRFLGLTFLLTLALLAFSKTGHRFEHLYMLYPLVPLFTASLMSDLSRLWRQRLSVFLFRTLFVLLFSALAWGDWNILQAYRSYLLKAGGYGEHSLSLMNLADFIRARGFKEVYFPKGEPVMRITLAFLSGWKLEIKHLDVQETESFGKTVAQADRLTAFVRVTRWRGEGARYPLSAALDHFLVPGEFKRVIFQTIPGSMEFTLFYRG